MASLEIVFWRDMASLWECEAVAEAWENREEPQGLVVAKHFLKIVAMPKVEALLVSRQVVTKDRSAERLQGRLVPKYQERVVAAKRKHRNAEHTTHKQEE